MSIDATEVLILLKAEQPSLTLQELRRSYRLTSVSPPRLAVVVGLSKVLGEIKRFQGVEAVFVDEVPDKLLKSLTPTEQLFIKAWLARQQDQKQNRPADKLPWDAPGFLPPDKPSKR